MSTKLAPPGPLGPASFWRTYRVAIERPDKSSYVWGNSDVGSSSIRMVFSAERNFGGPGPRTLQLSNLSPATRAILRRGTRVVVSAGYGSGLNTVFSGSVIKLHVQRTGAEIVTSMDLLDSEAFTRDCVIIQSYSASSTLAKKTGGVALRQVLSDILGKMAISYDPSAPIAIQAGDTVGLPDVRYPAGLTLNGTCGAMLDMVLRPLGLVWSIDDGVFSVIPRDGHRLAPVRILSAQSGLIGTPSVNELDFVQFQSLMDPTLRPGCIVQLQTQRSFLHAPPTAYYRLRKTVHQGDTHGGAWQVDCEAELYDGTVTLAPGIKQ